MKKKTSAAASQRFKQTNRFSSSLGEQALTALETSHQLQSAFKLDKDQGRFALPTFSLAGSKIADTCPQPPARCVKDAKVRFDQLGLAPSIQIKCSVISCQPCLATFNFICEDDIWTLQSTSSSLIILSVVM